VRILARLSLVTLVVVVVGSFFTPWTQNVPGEGQVIAYAPVDRETPIRAPISGRIESWHVVEGQHVEKGQLIAELSDNDPKILERLGRARDAVGAQGRAMASAIRIADEQVQALTEARDAALENASLKVRIASDRLSGKQQKLLAARAKAKTAAINLERQRKLNRDDLASDRELELAELSATTATAEVDQASADVSAAQREVSAARASLDEVRQKNRASIEKAKGQLEKLRAEAEKVGATVAAAETKLAQQEQMTIVAPRAGRILAITARQGTEFVKAGQSLATLVPETNDRAVQIWVDGNDAPLIGEGRKVRLQFEGWPAVQFVGWPSVAVGTFGGEVAFVDPAARADGLFRVVVVPDGDDEPWPEPRYLRQGVRARGWVLLNRVSVAFEIWRQLNGFPPAATPPKQSKVESFSADRRASK
jgi:multidrug efflux pump subunit AcrA (membrane-fusion protein)